MSETKNILIVAHTFPPAEGIGGRRWVKFGKYLVRKGNQVSVVCNKFPEKANSNWIKDVQGMDVFEFDFCYPKVLSGSPKSFLQKISYRLWIVLLKLFYNGSIYDRTIRKQKQGTDFIRNLIQEKKVEIIIITGAPFRLIYNTIQLKEEFPNKKFISDLRDPWTWGVSYGFSDLSAKRKECENLMEASVMKHSDYVLVPVLPMQEFLIEKYPDSKNGIKLIDHAYDEDDFSELNRPPRSKTDKVKLIYGGTLYPNLKEEVSNLVNGLSNCSNYLFEVYSNPSVWDNELRKLGDGVSLNGLTSVDVFFQKVIESDYFLVMISDRVKDFIATKYYEIIQLRIPIIYIGNEGELSNFIKENKLGIILTPDIVESEIVKILSGETEFSYNSEFNIEKYSFSNMTDKLTSLF